MSGSSRYIQIVSMVSEISDNAEAGSYLLCQYAEQIEGMVTGFAAAAEGSSDRSVAQVIDSLRDAEKQVLVAARMLAVAKKTGDDWCDGSGPQKTKTR